MGIKNINEFIRNKYINYHGGKNYYIITDLKYISGKTIAIDALNLLYKLKSKVVKEYINKCEFVFNKSWNEIENDKISSKLFAEFTNYLRVLKRFNINIIYVDDGKYPEEKKYKQEIKKEQYYNIKENLDLAKLNSESLSTYKKALIKYIWISNSERIICENIVLVHGYKIYRSNWESEQLCSKLCKDGQVFATLSYDTDLLAYSCPIIIKRIIDYNSYNPKIEICVLNDILDSLFGNLNFIGCKNKYSFMADLLLVLCCMCNNDYSNINNININNINNINNNYDLIIYELSKMNVFSIDILLNNLSKIKNFENIINIFSIFKRKVNYSEIDRKLPIMKEYIQSIISNFFVKRN
jgi:hypothetical protein